MWKLLCAGHVELRASGGTVRVSIFGSAKDVVVRTETYGSPIQNFLLVCLRLRHHCSGFPLYPRRGPRGSLNFGKTRTNPRRYNACPALGSHGPSRHSSDQRTRVVSVIRRAGFRRKDLGCSTEGTAGVQPDDECDGDVTSAMPLWEPLCHWRCLA